MSPGKMREFMGQALTSLIVFCAACGGSPSSATPPTAALVTAVRPTQEGPIPCTADDATAVKQGYEMANPCSELFNTLDEGALDCAQRAHDDAERRKAEPSLRQAQEKKHWATVVPGSSCGDAHRGVQVSVSAGDFTQSGNVISRDLQYSCGCPNAPVFSIVYEPKTSPLQVRLCKDQRADPCKMSCTGPESWDLKEALENARASEILYADEPPPCTCEGEVDPNVRGGPDWGCVEWCSCQADPDGENCQAGTKKP